MIYTSTLNQLPISTADIICTADGAEDNPVGWLWRALGYLVPGEVDHLVIYIGPGGRCIEAGAKGVLLFEVPNEHWDATQMAATRWILDTPIGLAYPLADRNLSVEVETHIREGVAQYCLEQAGTYKPYNLNFFNPATEAAFYCSQLVYKAYLQHGIDLTRALAVTPGADTLAPSIIFPQVIWQNCRHIRFPLTQPNSLEAGRDGE